MQQFNSNYQGCTASATIWSESVQWSSVKLPEGLT